MPINISSLATADLQSFLICLIALFLFCTGLILLRAAVADHNKRKEKDRHLKQNFEEYMNAIRATKRLARVIKDETQVSLSKDDMIQIFCSTIGSTTSSTSRKDLSCSSLEEPEGPSITLNIEG